MAKSIATKEPIVIEVVCGKDDDARVHTYQFDTEAEKHAFLLGAGEGEGWTRFAPYDHLEHGKLPKKHGIINISKGEITD